MADCKEKLADKDFQNWLTAALAIWLAKNGVKGSVMKDIFKFHSDVMNDILTPEQIQNKIFCSECTTDIIMPSSRRGRSNLPSCPNCICDKFRNKIILNHVNGTPSCEPTHAEKWCQSQWEVAKCYLPPKGYTKADSIENTDLNGVLSIILNLRPLSAAYDYKICEKAREVTRIVRHSPDLTLPTEKLNVCLETLVQFLSCSKVLENNEDATEAADKIRKLKASALEISKEDITNALNEELKNSLEQTRNQCINEILENMKNLQTTTSESIDKILTAKNSALSDIASAQKLSIEQLQQKTEELKTDSTYMSRKEKLKEDLLTFNWDLHTTIPLSPLFDKKDTPLQSFYVEPELYTVEHPLSKTRRSDIKRKISSMNNIFGINRCKEIYVTSKAGMGKTAFCKRLAFTWCQAHGPRNLKGQFNYKRDLAALRKFEFLFLVPLRNTLHQVEVDDMVESQVLHCLARSSLYTREFLQEILSREPCLVILDGLDEWTYPKDKRGLKHINDIPHRNARANCTILTTTRSWKYCTLSLSSNQIDLHVQILGLNGTSDRRLITNAFTKLGNGDAEYVSKNIDDFERNLSEHCIKKLKDIPLILICLICLWHEKRILGKTYCQIFINMIELLLHRAEIKCCVDSSRDVKKQRLEKPKILQDDALTYCKKYYDLLMSLGSLAFKTFFHTDRESSLVFNADLARNVLKDKFELCVNAGFLTQTRGLEGQLTENSLRVSFAHKTFQEFFAALYLHNLDASSLAMEEIKRECSSVEGILSVSNFYVFLCGIAPNMAKILSTVFSEVITGSKTLIGYRSDMGSWNYFVGYNETIKKLQTLFVDCFTEGTNNRHQLEFKIEDFIIDEDFERDSYSDPLKLLMKKNKEHVKSVKIRNVSSGRAFSDIVELLGLNASKSLEKIDLKCTIDDKNLECVLHAAEHTLKCFIIKGCIWLGNQWRHDHIQLSNKSLQLIWSMALLEELYLRNIEMTHKQCVCLLDFVSGKSNMKHIGLGFIRCTKHGDNCQGIKLDLSKHSRLKMLEIGSLPISDIEINTTSLEVCYVGDFKAKTVLKTVFETLPQATGLRVFCCGFLTSPKDAGTMLATILLLKNLQTVWLTDMNLTYSAFQQRFSMEKIESFSMIRVQMDCHTFKALVKSVENAAKAVRVCLYDCAVKPENEFEEEKNRIKTSHTMHLIQDDPDVQKKFIFRTLTKEHGKDI